MSVENDLVRVENDLLRGELPPPDGAGPGSGTPGTERRVRAEAPRLAPGAEQRVVAQGGAGPVALTPRRAPHPSLALVTADLLGVLVGGLVAGVGRGWEWGVLAGVLLALTARSAGLYRPGPETGVLDEVPALCARTALAWAVVAALLAAVRPAAALPLSALVTAWAAQSLVAASGRGLVHGRRRARRRARPAAALLIGDARTHTVAAVLRRCERPVVLPVGIVGPRAGTPGDVPVLGSADEVRRALGEHDVRLALCVGEPSAAYLRLLRAHGCALWRLDARGPGHGAAPGTTGLAGYPLTPLPPGPRRPGAGKRALDLALAGPALVLLSPLLLACALAVRLSDGPGVLFRQERVGQYGKTFTLLKFRSLRPCDDREAATRWNVAHDDRMSRVGRFLRRSSLDELPQLWNILRGDMSLVGPRPERPFFVAEFGRTYAGYRHRHRAPVGLTGLAQISGLRGDTSIEDRSRHDNYYVDHWSFWLDVRILARTALSLVRPSGS
ncbi:exopolysaccharide biosynthesis polyprenyl glycosylphosphotransferase [Streptomyces evansiae]|uniref:exopolysaccharide biosynthesis polyprenyl glycosylphosphotransferase n=1 Tax=Streptomyces evansiae TaxID=3075535 RepID=UPI00288AE208|nr:exopolysaccharide biosynthesis polyprenyl glycosylphosphotransferase [Streptomyces sp. DSM 41859]